MELRLACAKSQLIELDNKLHVEYSAYLRRSDLSRPDSEEEYTEEQLQYGIAIQKTAADMHQQQTKLHELLNAHEQLQQKRVLR